MQHNMLMTQGPALAVLICLPCGMGGKRQAGGRKGKGGLSAACDRAPPMPFFPTSVQLPLPPASLLCTRVVSPLACFTIHHHSTIQRGRLKTLFCALHMPSTCAAHAHPPPRPTRLAQAMLSSTASASRSWARAEVSGPSCCSMGTSSRCTTCGYVITKVP